MKAILFLLLPFILTSYFITTKNVRPANDTSLIGSGQMPLLTSDDRGNIHLVYGIGDSLLYRYSPDKGQSFNQPQLIAVIDGLHASATRGPQIAVTKNGVSVVASVDAGSIYSFTKATGGKWIRGNRVTDADSVALEGFVSLAGDGNSSLFAIWLDLRKNKRNSIYGARSADGGKTWSKNMMIYASPDSTVCECCKPTVAMSGGKVYVMFRNWLKGNRDLYLIESSDYGRSFGQAKKLGIQSWALNGCPMDGGSVVVNKKGIAQTVWNRKGSIYSCEPGKEEKAIGQGRSCTMETANGENMYAWIENGQVVVVNAKGIKKVLGKGYAATLKAADSNHLLCIWENEKKLYKVLLPI